MCIDDDYRNNKIAQDFTQIKITDQRLKKHDSRESIAGTAVPQSHFIYKSMPIIHVIHHMYEILYKNIALYCSFLAIKKCRNILHGISFLIQADCNIHILNILYNNMLYNNFFIELFTNE